MLARPRHNFPRPKVKLPSQHKVNQPMSILVNSLPDKPHNKVLDRTTSLTHSSMGKGKEKDSLKRNNKQVEMGALRLSKSNKP